MFNWKFLNKFLLMLLHIGRIPRRTNNWRLIFVSSVSVRYLFDHHFKIPNKTPWNILDLSQTQFSTSARLWKIFSYLFPFASDLWRLVFVARLKIVIKVFSFWWLRKFWDGKVCETCMKREFQAGATTWRTWLQSYVRTSRRYKPQHDFARSRSSETFHAAWDSSVGKSAALTLRVAWRTTRRCCMERHLVDVMFFLCISHTLRTTKEGEKLDYIPMLIFTFPHTSCPDQANVIRSREWEERRARRSHKEWKYVLILCVSKKPQEFSLTVRQKTHEKNSSFLSIFAFYFIYFFTFFSSFDLFSGEAKSSKNKTRRESMG